jgi:ubiquinone/menaquinone biosynthesis C-methylase UbiE
MGHTERRFDPNKRQGLVNTQRQARWDPPRFLTRFDLKAGQVVVELGCGPGFWTLPLAEIVGPTGAVWALDVSQEMLDALTEHQPPEHVYLIRTELPQTQLPEATADFVWGAFVYHEVDPPMQLAAELRRVTRSGGRVAILDWRPDAASDDGPPRAHRVAPQQVIDHLRTAGFQSVALTWQDTDVYLIEARLSGES